MTAPLIATLQLDRESQDYFNRLRRAHFPPRVNLWEYHNGPWLHKDFFGFHKHLAAE